MREIDRQVEREIRELVYDYFASECDIDRNRLTDETDIIEELEGDSLMLLSLLESSAGTAPSSSDPRRPHEQAGNTIGQSSSSRSPSSTR
jgi:hypothetical protein